MVGVDYNEIKHFQNMHSIGASEACWRLFQFNITDRHPAVMPLRIHLKGAEYVVFNEGEEQAIVAEDAKQTELTAFFKYNAQHPETQVKYVDFPKHFTYSSSGWHIRKKGEVIGRIHTLHPLSGDEFYLRMLLHHNHCKGANSYEDLKTVQEVVLETFKEVCGSIGLLQDDNEWSQLLEEAAQTRNCLQLRVLFVVVLLFCEPSNPRRLYDQHVSEWWDDLKWKHPLATDSQLAALVCLDIECKLQERGQELKNFNLPSIEEEQRQQLRTLTNQMHNHTASVIMQEELNFNFTDTCNERDNHLSMLNSSQKAVFDEVMESVHNKTALTMFIDARGGTGKTFLLNTLLAASRTVADSKHIALAVASSGIAATLLSLGRTFHSRFRVPLNPTETTTFSIKPNDVTAAVLKETRLIVWDEAPMSHRYLLEGLDRTRQDVLQTKQPFGGKVLIVAGHFRQVLPVIPRASGAQIISASIRKSPLWNLFRIRQLTQNMRIGVNAELQYFDNWLCDMGNGCIPLVETPDTVELPVTSIFPIDNSSLSTTKQTLKKFISEIYPDLGTHSKLPTAEWLPWVSERAILAPKNSTADEINTAVSELLPGQPFEVYSADSTVDPNDATRFPTEYLNSLTPTGLPPHKLIVKVITKS